MPKASRKGSFAVGEAGAKLAGAFESEAANLARLFYDWTISRLDDLANPEATKKLKDCKTEKLKD